MYKLVILIEAPDDWSAFEAGWPQFLHHAERMPGLRREATSRVEEVLFGNRTISIVHELFFDSRQAAQEAMASPQGSEAGRRLQELTQGRMTLLFAEHKEDELENILKYRQDEAESGPLADSNASVTRPRFPG